eukprot:TRINITY_DN14338_c0_g1_i1.p1 TRINITY_DN14338_c0_g1~~TRINITY_DN14338_c0_g1_i1.p1  ORF type:complete len:362 (+),score=109.67 TRINITY_DN14338_c0_g1_i1:641-1726(+)
MSERSSASVVGKNGREQTLVTFEPTPKMSTYILCVCVGEFESVSAACGEVMVRCLAPAGTPDVTNQLQFALSVGVKSLALYNRFFNIAYPLPKLDMVAVPDFSCGAMENWGLIAYREIDLLLDEASASAPRKQRVAVVVAHEIAHQWFGNLVTMAWWDDLWLNEGFANWMQNYVADALFPEWGMWEGFVAAEQTSALTLDSLGTSHPIKVPIARAEHVEEVFDEISYFKGGSVVRMAFQLLGEDVFRAGLSAYMAAHSHANTTSDDLWNSWEAAAHAAGAAVPVKQILDTWTLQKGYPLLTVHSATHTDGRTVLDVEQEWFLADGSPPLDDRRWVVPVIAGGAAGAQGLQYLETRRGEIVV